MNSWVLMFGGGAVSALCAVVYVISKTKGEVSEGPNFMLRAYLPSSAKTAYAGSNLGGSAPQTTGGFAASANLGTPPPDPRWSYAPNPAGGSALKPPF